MSDKELQHCVGVYLFHNPETDETYVGSSKNLYSRRNDHERQLQNSSHNNKRFQEAFNRNPNFEFVAVPTSDREEAFNLEQAIINEFRGHPLFLNLSYDARYCSVMHSQEVKDKLSQVHKGNTYNLGRVASEETRQKISAALTGVPRDPERMRKFAEAKHRPVLCNGVEYPSIKAAAAALNVNHDFICKRTKNPNFPEWKRL